MAEFNETTNMYGVVRGVYSCNSERTQELSDRMASRNIPSSYLQPQFSTRPVSTKYDFLPIIDRRAPATEKLIETPTYNINKTFNPGNSGAPWSGFPTHINDESTLRNQFFALQRGDQHVYVPPLYSDLYLSVVKSDNKQLPFKELFEEEQFNDFNPNVCDLGHSVFNNNTRIQLKNL